MALEKRPGPDLDALARTLLGLRGRILEGGVRGPARHAFLLRVVDLEHQRLLAAHAREPVPAMPGIVGARVGLALAVLIDALRDDEVLKRDTACIANREREGLDRMP